MEKRDLESASASALMPQLAARRAVDAVSDILKEAEKESASASALMPQLAARRAVDAVSDILKEVEGNKNYQ